MFKYIFKINLFYCQIDKYFKVTKCNYKLKNILIFQNKIIYSFIHLGRQVYRADSILHPNICTKIEIKYRLLKTFSYIYNQDYAEKLKLCCLILVFSRKVNKLYFCEKIRYFYISSFSYSLFTLFTSVYISSFLFSPLNLFTYLPFFSFL